MLFLWSRFLGHETVRLSEHKLGTNSIFKNAIAFSYMESVFRYAVTSQVRFEVLAILVHLSCATGNSYFESWYLRAD